jgi:hypothetical protein
MRTYERCYPFLHQNIIDELSPDVYIHTWKDRGGTWKRTPPTNKQHRLDQDIYPADQDLAKMEIKNNEIKQMYSAEEVVVEQFQDSFYTKLDGVSVPEKIYNHEDFDMGILPMFYKMKKCVELKTKYERNNRFTYDNVILMRPDVAVFEPLPDQIINNNNYLWESGSETKNYTDDIFLVGSSEIIDYYTRIFDKLDYYWKNIDFSSIGFAGRPVAVSAEALVNHHMKQSDIEIRHGKELDYTRGNDWYLIRYEDDVYFLNKNQIERLTHILNYGDTGFQSANLSPVEIGLLSFKEGFGAFEHSDIPIQAGIKTLRQDGIRRFIHKSMKYLTNNRP